MHSHQHVAVRLDVPCLHGISVAPRKKAIVMYIVTAGGIVEDPDSSPHGLHLTEIRVFCLDQSSLVVCWSSIAMKLFADCSQSLEIWRVFLSGFKVFRTDEQQCHHNKHENN